MCHKATVLLLNNAHFDFCAHFDPKLVTCMNFPSKITLETPPEHVFLVVFEHMCISLSYTTHVSKTVFLDLFDSNPSSAGCMLLDGIHIQEVLRKKEKYIVRMDVLSYS